MGNHFRRTKEQMPNFKRKGEQRQCWGTGNIKKICWGGVNKHIYFRASLILAMLLVWEITGPEVMK